MQKKVASIARQLQLVFGVSIVILLISSTASYLSNQKLIDTSKWVNHTNEVILEANNLANIIRIAESNQRGYIISNNHVFLDVYKGSYEKAILSFNRLKSLTSDNVAQQQNLAEMKVIMDERFRHMSSVIAMVNNTGLAGRATLFVDNPEVMKGKKVMDDLVNVSQRIRSEEQKLLDVRLKEQQTYITYTPPLVIIAAVLAILISILSYVRIKADLDERVRKQLEDEAKYQDTVKRINIMESVTKRIAGGDFKVRSADDKADELGRISHALNDMAQSLQTNFEELEQRNWLQTGVVSISDAMRGERYLNNVAAKVISSICNYVNARLGTLYIVDQDLNLKFAGGYAVSDAQMEIREGDGLAAQAAKDRRMIVLDNVPANYLKVSSSTGHMLPIQLVICPLMYNHEVIGVLELAMLRPMSEMELNFLNDNAEAIAIGLNAAIVFERVQNLLEETQAQSEELQAQHNELENINTELEAQSEKLQASEEELRVQQEELQEANAELEERSRLLEESYQKIAEQNVEVTRKADELALTTKYKSEFLANMSHELRTPLNSILLLSRLLTENTEKNLNNDQVEYAKVILSSGNGLLSLIDEILDLSKIEAGKMLLEFEQVNIVDITNDMNALFEPVANDKGLEFVISQEDNVKGLRIETDKQRLEQVLKNLISNALKFTSNGSVSINIAKASHDDSFVSFEVIDTGIGIVADKQKMIFEAFQQEDGSTRRRYGGTGLGLSISKELIKLLGGDIELKSEPGKGSTFSITVPINKPDIKEQKVIDTPVFFPEPEPKPQVEEKIEERFIASNIPESIPDDRMFLVPGDHTILIVEDDVNFARSLLDYTRSKGYKGIVSVRGDQGVALAREYMPTGILLDIELPVMNGWEVMEALKKDPSTRHIPVHIMSSHEVKKESLMKGAVDFINKPFAFEQIPEVFNKLEYVLNNKSKKVLIVEENPKHAKALAYFLETCNVNSEIKHNVNDSITALKHEAQCVILDMGIPDQRSYDTLEEIKKDPQLADLPIIIFTGKSLSFSEEQRIKHYADSIVVKTAHSYQRIFDEVSIFLHLMQQNKAKGTDKGNKKLGMLNDVLKNKTVLIVDDDVRNIFSLTKALEQLDMNIIPAVDGKEAMEKLKDNKNIDLVLLDMMMPEMDGYETATAIRQKREWKDLPVIAVTAKAMVGDRDKCIKAGASDYISKPVDIDQLLSLLRVWLYENK